MRKLCLLLCLLLALSGCGKPAETEITGPSCTVSVSCATILENMEKLDPEKSELVPADGCLLPETKVALQEGDSVFDLLLRVCLEHNLHMEYVDTPLYDSAYIEGIGNLYEFDCGNESGWMYSVNGMFPNYGCSQHKPQNGDVICWVYTCDLGRDVGDSDWAEENSHS